MAEKPKGPVIMHILPGYCISDDPNDNEQRQDFIEREIKIATKIVPLDKVLDQSTGKTDDSNAVSHVTHGAAFPTGLASVSSLSIKQADSFTSSIPDLETGVHALPGQRRLPLWEQVCITIFALATATFWGAFTAVILPKEISDMVPNRNRGPALGGVSAASATVGLFLPLIAASFTDRCTSRLGRRRPFVLVGSLISITAVGLMYLGRTHKWLSLFVVSYILASVGLNTALTGHRSLIPDLVVPEQQGLVAGWKDGLASTGTLLGSVVGGLVFIDNPGRAYVLLGSVIVFCTIVTLVGTRERKLTAEEALSQPTFIPYLKSLWISPSRHPDFFKVCTNRTLVVLGFYIFAPYFQYFLVDVVRTKQAVRVSAWTAALFGISAAVCALVAGAASDRIGRKIPDLVFNLMLSGVSIAFIFVRTVPQALGLASALGACIGSYQSVNWAMALALLPKELNVAAEMAVWNIATQLPQIFAGPLGGGILASSGTWRLGAYVGYTVHSYTVLFSVCASLSFVACIPLLLVRKVR